jgi:hypothetical protein
MRGGEGGKNMIAAVKFGDIFLSTARDTLKKDRITFQDFVINGIEKGTLNLDDLVDAYGAVGGPMVPTHFPYDPMSWSQEDRYRGKMLFYTFKHRYILLSCPYEYGRETIWRIDTHFHFGDGRIWLKDGMSRSELLSFLNRWAYRSRSKDFCWVISFLLGAFFCTQSIQWD